MQLVVATRRSALALAQTRAFVRDLCAGNPGLSVEELQVVTTGDKIQDRPLSEIGGKGLFTKEIEDALLADEIDLAVHSMKDMQTALPVGLMLGATLPREDVRDAFLSLTYKSLDEVPAGAVVGSSSLRRQAQLLNARPDLTVVGFRGNVQTRLKKLQDGVAEATFLAVAGLNRLGMSDRITAAIALDQMLPAVAQGAIGLEIRAGDEATADLIAPLNHAESALAVTAERAFLTRLEGSCRTPIAGHAYLADGKLHFLGRVLSTDGKVSYAVSRVDAPETALAMGHSAADEVLANADPAALVRPTT